MKKLGNIDLRLRAMVFFDGNEYMQGSLQQIIDDYGSE